MDQRRNGRYRVLTWTIRTLVSLVTVMGRRLILGRPSFDAVKVAGAEARMWQAYYARDTLRLGMELISLLRNMHGLSLLEAKEIGKLLASSAMKFRSAGGDGGNIALAALTEAYGLIKRASGASFDPEEAARAELAWWVARRTPGQDSAEQVGKKIAELYGLLYGEDHPSFLTAGVLRAEAARLRDLREENADWRHIENLLRKSYLELKKAI